MENIVLTSKELSYIRDNNLDLINNDLKKFFKDLKSVSYLHDKSYNNILRFIDSKIIAGSAGRENITSYLDEIPTGFFEGTTYESLCIKGNVKDIKPNAFKSMPNLRKVTIILNADNKFLSGYSGSAETYFEDCPNLVDVSISDAKCPNSIYYVPAKMFVNCKNLKDLALPGHAQELTINPAACAGADMSQLLVWVGNYDINFDDIAASSSNITEENLAGYEDCFPDDQTDSTDTDDAGVVDDQAAEEDSVADAAADLSDEAEADTETATEA